MVVSRPGEGKDIIAGGEILTAGAVFKDSIYDYFEQDAALL